MYSHKIWKWLGWGGGACEASKQLWKLRSVKGLAPPTVPTDFISPTDPVEMRSCCLAHPDILTLPPPMTFSAAYTDFPHRGHFSDSPNFAENLEGLLVVAARAGFGDLVEMASGMKTALGTQLENCASRDVPHSTVPLSHHLQ